MTTGRFDGVIKPLRRGGWSAKARLTIERHSQLFETFLGAALFDTEAASREWLHTTASRHAIDAARIFVTIDRPASPL